VSSGPPLRVDDGEGWGRVPGLDANWPDLKMLEGRMPAAKKTKKEKDNHSPYRSTLGRRRRRMSHVWKKRGRFGPNGKERDRREIDLGLYLCGGFTHGPQKR